MLRMAPAAARTETKLGRTPVVHLLVATPYPRRDFDIRNQVAPGQRPPAPARRGAHRAGKEAAAGAVARRSPHRGRRDWKRVAECQPAGRTGAAVPARAGGHAGASIPPRRAEHDILESTAERRPVGRLAPEASDAALRKPLGGRAHRHRRRRGSACRPESQGYPYFVQTWGEAVWQQVRGSGEMRRRVARADTARAQARFDRSKNGYYLERYDELVDRDLLPVARTVADAFAQRNLLNDEQLDTAIARGLDDARHPEDVTAARDRAEPPGLHLAAGNGTDVGGGHPESHEIRATLRAGSLRVVGFNALSFAGTESTASFCVVDCSPTLRRFASGAASQRSSPRRSGALDLERDLRDGGTAVC